jgi:hypothetical protein
LNIQEYFNTQQSRCDNLNSHTNTVVCIRRYVAGKNLQAYQGPHARFSVVKIETKDMVSPKRGKMMQNTSHAGGQHFFS